MDNNEAQQIAMLVNERNNLQKAYTASEILQNQQNYVFLIEEGMVAACAEVKKVQWYQAEVCHVSTNKKFEGKGYASRVLKMAEEKAIVDNARILQCTIRANNNASIKLFTGKSYEKTTSFYNKESGNWVNVYHHRFLHNRYYSSSPSLLYYKGGRCK